MSTTFSTHSYATRPKYFETRNWHVPADACDSGAELSDVTQWLSDAIPTNFDHVQIVCRDVNLTHGIKMEFKISYAVQVMIPASLAHI